MNSLALMERLRSVTDPEFRPFAGAAEFAAGGHLDQFLRLYSAQDLSAVFQPILDFRARGYLGFEGLIRGPADSPFHTPAALFAAARELGITVEFERLCRKVVLEGFARQRLPGRLFINVSISALADPYFIKTETAEMLAPLGLHPSQIVIELTENQHVSDFSALHDVLATYRKFGYQIAVDDLGEGFSNLRMWSEIRPEFVKIDRHFISGIADDALKFQLVRAMQELGETSHAALIAEGIETEAEFSTVRDLGISFGQGFLISRPQARPETAPTLVVMNSLARSELIVFPSAARSAQSVTAASLASWAEPVLPATRNDALFDLFEQRLDLQVIPVVNDEGIPLGLVNRHVLVDRFARPYRREVFGKKPCTLFMNPPLVVDESVNVQEVGQLLGRADPHHMMDGFIVTRQGRYLGIGSTQALMALITDMQIRAARYANPLTQLPGNVPINEHIDRLLAANARFVACYCDLDSFKPYNDLYGYRRGDEVIQLVGNLLSECTDRHADFVGHIGGDDFITVLQTETWVEALQAVLVEFDRRILALIEAEHAREGGYWGEDRRGQPVFHSLPALSIGCVEVEPGDFRSHHEVSAAMSAAKKQAKKRREGERASRLFIERRRGSAQPAILQ